MKDIPNLEEMTLRELVELHNSHSQNKVNKFSDKETAIRRVKQVLEADSVTDHVDQKPARVPQKRRSRLIDISPTGDNPVMPREGSRRLEVLTLATGGYTSAEIIEKMGWKQGFGRARLREALRLLNRENNYGFRENENGVLEVLP